MADSFVGEIRIFAGTFAPMDWAFCDGRTLQISQYDVLYSLIGTTYGGDGSTYFNLPDLRGRVPIHRGQGAGLTNRTVGQGGGAETATVSGGQVPVHQHTFQATTAQATSSDPSGKVLAVAGAETYGPVGGTVNMSPQGIGATGGSSQPHENMQPFLCINYIISLVGIYPSRS